MGKIIRDPVHGDIFVPEKYIKIIDTRVFQRLRRIKQLATEEYVYPQATHSRFVHSIGTFHIMRLIINHFCEIFQYLNISVSNYEKDAILVAALLHDVGHGPLSHAFEKVIQKSHEEWTKEIIKKDEELNSVIKNEFGDGFDDLVINYLGHFSSNIQPSQNVENLQDLFSELISSQLDADRLDYLLRDAYNTGVKLAAIDLQKIISSMELTRYNGANHFCINEDALSNVEQVIIGRYNMYDKIYHAPYKIFSEELFVRLINHISNNSKIKSISKLFYSIKRNDISLEQYINLDDSKIFNEINQYIDKTNDGIARSMLASLMNRTGYRRIRLMDESPEAFNCFFNEIKSRTGIDINSFECSVITARKTYSAYNFEKNKNEILISLRNGITKKLSDVSVIVKKDGEENLLWSKVRSCLYMNVDILRMEYDSMHLNEKLEFDEFTKILIQLINSYEIRNHTEIERKESCTQETLNKTMLFLNNSMINSTFIDGYRVISKSDIDQFDIYYDTKNYDLAKNNFSFRCRDKRDGKYVWTIKSSDSDTNTNNNGQFIRSEFEMDSDSKKLSDLTDFISAHIDAISPACENVEKLFSNKIFVKNHRVSYIVERFDSNDDTFKCEISLDKIIYNSKYKDYQIEFELKSQYHIYQVELNSFVDAFNEKLGIIQPKNEIESKYQKALKSMGINFY